MRQRKPNRLQDYNYSTPGAYFITVCAHKRFENRNIFGSIHNGEMIKNSWVALIESCWCDLPNHYANISLDEFIIMPDHIHGILWINDMNVGNGFKPFPTGKTQHGLPEIIRGLKTFSSRRINEINDKEKFQCQKSYYDHIIRNDKSLLEIRKYIQSNPRKWILDHDCNEKNDIVKIIRNVGNGSKPFPTTGSM